MRRAWLLALLCLGCLQQEPLPADEELMGTFEFVAEPLSAAADGGLPDCAYPEVEATRAGFAFSATLSRKRGGEDAVVSVNLVRHPGRFDGQTVQARYVAPRRFAACSCATAVEMSETLSVVLLSRSQSDALGGACPERPLDGGVPAPDVDAGLLPPSTSANGGFDALRACGELTDLITPLPEACGDCQSCRVRYAVKGVRK